jgi:DNA modification methylase
MLKSESLSVEWRAIETVRPYPGNPRIIPETAIDKVAASIREFGWRQPIVVDEGGEILVGHTRRLAAMRLGIAEVPVHVAVGLSDEQRRAYRLADNRTGEESRWDLKALGLELQGLGDAGFELALLGFDRPELISLEPRPEPAADPDDVPPAPIEPLTQLGDVWILGEHRIICGDSTSRETVDRLLAGDKPRLMVTDPPYGVEYDADWRNRVVRANGSKVQARAVGKVLNDDRDDWREAWALFPGSVAYVWHAGSHALEVAVSLQAAGFLIRTQIIWGKNQLVISRGHYHPQHEPCWYAVREGDTAGWTGGRKQSTLWSIAKPQKSETGHSTQKPVECMARPIRNNSRAGDLVYEPFSGSGTTIIACEQERRRCQAIELSPAYVDVAVRRWESFTGRTASRA